MKIVIVLEFKLKNESYINLLNEYISRIKWYIPIEVIETKSVIEFLNKETYNILLDRSGKEFSSLEFEDFLSKLLLRTNKNIYFFIGGAEGFKEDILKKADFTVSLSRLTFAHELATVIFAEQLYRAFTIINNEKYHK
ncbi:MAG: 23S rRNA (pseudouridine(1915)-N(3))-methyltransferase RlmH [Caldisericaceae bacterium]